MAREFNKSIEDFRGSAADPEGNVCDATPFEKFNKLRCTIYCGALQHLRRASRHISMIQTMRSPYVSCATYRRLPASPSDSPQRQWHSIGIDRYDRDMIHPLLLLSNSSNPCGRRNQCPIIES